MVSEYNGNPVEQNVIVVTPPKLHKHQEMSKYSVIFYSVEEMQKRRLKLPIRLLSFTTKKALHLKEPTSANTEQAT